jgi:hypothetical protein
MANTLGQSRFSDQDVVGRLVLVEGPIVDLSTTSLWFNDMMQGDPTMKVLRANLACGDMQFEDVPDS